MLEIKSPSQVLGLDDFIYGKGGSGKSYITHTKFPRFVALINIEKLKVDVSNVVWWDEKPLGQVLDNLLSRAAATIESAVLEEESRICTKIKSAMVQSEEQFNIEIDTLRDSEERLQDQAQQLVSLAEEQQLNIEKRKAAELALILSEEQLQIQISELRDSEERMALQAQELVWLAEDLQTAEQEMKFLAHHDALTKLPSRRLCMDRLELAMTEDRRNGSKTAVLFIDLDGFKAVNDTIGHEAGDTVLIGVAERIKSIVRENDTAARIGGDEFILLLRDVGRHLDVAVIAQTIIAELSRPFLIKGQEVKIGASIGIAFSPDDGSTSEDILKNADQSMYVIKHQGKNNFGFFSTDLNELK
ncbi:diguanylate cyclase domain-containing protein [Kiloniella sp.]|uniref:diguanylate cyclase domain-containing protein n=1 Tax=Kiloniella sp. TaxID=1938587 RepID=UPI003B011C36